ncbi:MAG: DUF4234 domain-containing protein [Bacteroidetes bacterium]|nr:DUF4234 domain-containing protein [Bacteroidota bacterium]
MRLYGNNKFFYLVTCGIYPDVIWSKGIETKKSICRDATYCVSTEVINFFTLVPCGIYPDVIWSKGIETPKVFVETQYFASP